MLGIYTCVWIWEGAREIEEIRKEAWAKGWTSTTYGERRRCWEPVCPLAILCSSPPLCSLSKTAGKHSLQCIVTYIDSRPPRKLQRLPKLHDGRIIRLRTRPVPGPSLPCFRSYAPYLVPPSLSPSKPSRLEPPSLLPPRPQTLVHADSSSSKKFSASSPAGQTTSPPLSAPPSSPPSPW